jgi:hypothetical protein
MSVPPQLPRYHFHDAPAVIVPCTDNVAVVPEQRLVEEAVTLCGPHAAVACTVTEAQAVELQVPSART